MAPRRRTPPGAGLTALRYDERPDDDTPVSTADLPATPVRDRNIKATSWREAPPELLHLGEDLPDQPVADYKRRIGPRFLWQAGPATDGDARYFATDLTRHVTFRLDMDSTAEGTGPDGSRPARASVRGRNPSSAVRTRANDEIGIYRVVGVTTLSRLLVSFRCLTTKSNRDDASRSARCRRGRRGCRGP